jgi:uncharacterized protein DUF3693
MMFGDDPKDLARRLIEMHRIARDRCLGNQIEASGLVKQWVLNDRLATRMTQTAWSRVCKRLTAAAARSISMTRTCKEVATKGRCHFEAGEARQSAGTHGLRRCSQGRHQKRRRI